MTRPSTGPGDKAEQPGLLDRRVQSLDLLRALAVFLVICHHAGYRVRPTDGDVLSEAIYRVGWIGVDLFFVISGLLIASILKKPDFSLSSFMRRRVFRIIPLYSVAMATFIVASLVLGRSDSLENIWSPLLLLNGWTVGAIPEDQLPYIISWSLSVEETAYIVLSLAAAFSLPALRLVLLLAALLPLALRAFVFQTGAIDPAAIYFFVPARIDVIALGGLVALGLLGPARHWATLVGGIAALLLFAWFATSPLQSYGVIVFGLTAFALATAKCVQGVVAMESRAAAAGRAGWMDHWLVKQVRDFGRLSYFIYLFHLFVLEAVLMAMGDRMDGSVGMWTVIAVCALLTFALARISWRFFEAPLIRRGYADSWRAALLEPKASRAAQIPEHSTAGRKQAR